ncbi:MAG: hypothetical protein ACKOE6_11465, partial [Flammeovirgaceae bacterium]
PNLLKSKYQNKKAMKHFKLRTSTWLRTSLTLCLFVTVFACNDSKLEENESFKLSSEHTQSIKSISNALISYNTKFADAQTKKMRMAHIMDYVNDVATLNGVTYHELDESLISNADHEYTINDLSSPLRSRINSFNDRLNQIAENDNLSDEQSITQLRSICNDISLEAARTNELAVAEKEALMAACDYSSAISQPTYDYLVASNQNHEARLFGRIFRALARVVAAVVTTAVIIAVPVAAAVLIKAAVVGAKVASIKIGAAKGMASILKSAVVKGKVGKLSMAAPYMTGLGAGLKNAEKNWSKEWKGIEEFTFGYKIKL